MELFERVRTQWIEARATARMLVYLPRLLPRARWSSARLVAALARRSPGKVGLAYEDLRFTWMEIDQQANRYAAFFVDQGIGYGDVVALVMDNRPEFLFALTGLNRVGAVAALINHNLRGKALAHAINAGKPRAVIVGDEHLATVGQVRPDLDGITHDRDLWVQRDPRAGRPDAGDLRVIDAEVAACRGSGPARLPVPRASDRMCFIYTSGTTGLPKAAIITNQRWVLAAHFFGRLIGEATAEDVIYTSLPLYHSTGMLAGWGAALASGATLALRRRFSVSNFWNDVRAFEATIFIYIGELCRYLQNAEVDPRERAHRLRLAMGNGLRPDIWERFQARFGVPLIREFYGATEGNTPLVNLEGRPGMIGRLGPGQLIVRCDPATGEPLRNPAGLLDPVEVGGKGLLLGKISRLATFDGYLDRSATEKKILHDVRATGDAYFNSGDIVQLHEGRWVSFADRVGDTFRWKGENVSTNEVADILNGARGVLESNVYGVVVPGAEGRAGMASLRTTDQFDLQAFARFVLEKLPGFQRPHFVRIQGDMRTTSTFKYQKVDYREEGYDPRKVSDPVYLLHGDRYVPITDDLFQRIASGEIGPR